MNVHVRCSRFVGETLVAGELRSLRHFLLVVTTALAILSVGQSHAADMMVEWGDGRWQPIGSNEAGPAPVPPRSPMGHPSQRHQDSPRSYIDSCARLGNCPSSGSVGGQSPIGTIAPRTPYKAGGETKPL